MPPEGSSLLTAAASPASHASYSASAEMLGMIDSFCGDRGLCVGVAAAGVGR